MPPPKTKQNPHTSVGGSIPSRATSSQEEDRRDTPGQTLPSGTRIRFLKDIVNLGHIYARAGELGTVKEGDYLEPGSHWVFWDGFPTAFRATLGEDFEAVPATPEPWGFALWQHLHQEHGLTLVESELQEIVRLARPLIVVSDDKTWIKDAFPAMFANEVEREHEDAFKRLKKIKKGAPGA